MLKNIIVLEIKKNKVKGDTMKKKRNIIITVIVAVCMAAVVVLSYCKEAGLFVPKQLTTKEQQENPEALAKVLGRFYAGMRGADS